jgi:DNA-binding NarL/FixJ family response regulator
VGTDPLLGAARHAEGCADFAAAGYDAAREAFEDAVGLLARAGLPFEAARARVALARSLRALGRTEAARRELDQAHAEFLSLGAAAEERGTRQLRAGRPNRRVQLSPREREVLGLVAQGKTNAEIALVLVLSEHTVHRHVSNILAKLGTSSRAAAVGTAVEQGLL